MNNAAADEMFEQAAQGDLFNMDDHKGELVVFWPIEFEADFNTINGLADIIYANVLVADGEHAGEFFENSMIFGKVIVPSLKPKIGKQVLGRIGQGAKQPGKSPAWIIQPYTDEDVDVALEAIRAHKAGEFEAPAEAAAETPAAKAPARAAAKAPAAKKEAALTEQQDTLARTLLAGGTPPEMIAAATGATLTQLADAGIIELQ